MLLIVISGFNSHTGILQRREIHPSTRTVTTEPSIRKLILKRSQRGFFSSHRTTNQKNIVVPQISQSHNHYNVLVLNDTTYTLLLFTSTCLGRCKASDLEAFSQKPTDNSFTSLRLTHVLPETRTESSSRTHAS